LVLRVFVVWLPSRPSWFGVATGAEAAALQQLDQVLADGERAR
jgi:hypothetical protein